MHNLVDSIIDLAEQAKEMLEKGTLNGKERDQADIDRLMGVAMQEIARRAVEVADYYA